MMRTLKTVFLVILGITLTNSLSTIHHDKPEAMTISILESTTDPSELSSTPLSSFNVTLSPTERKKRLLPYRNFYFSQPFNRPHQASVSTQQYKNYEEDRPLPKKPEYDSVNYRPKNVFYQSGQKFTPFSESNALPGHFRPMVNPNNKHQNVQYVYLNSPQPQEENYLPSNEEVPQKHQTNNKPPVQYVYVNAAHQEEKYAPPKEKTPPDFSAIYDKLSQLKLRQQELHNKTPYGHRLIQHHRFRERPQKHQEYRPTIFDKPTRFKITPSKTTIETFTATNIDIPDQYQEEKYEFDPPRYHQIPTPTKEQLSVPAHNNYRDSTPKQEQFAVHNSYREDTKPFIRHQIAIEIPQSSLPLTFSPSLVRKPPRNKEIPRKPYIFIQQGKPDAKQPVLILRKSKPSVVIDENFVAEKYTPHIPNKSHHHHRRPIYVHQEPTYTPAPIYDNSFDTQYQVTPAPNEQEYESYVPHSTTPNYNHLEYGAKLNQPPPKFGYVQVVASSTPQYEHENEYYHYQTVTPGSTSSVSPVTVGNPIRVTQKLIPQYQEEEVSIRVTPKIVPQYQEEAVSIRVTPKVRPQYQEQEQPTHIRVPQKIVPHYQEQEPPQQHYQEEQDYQLEEYRVTPQPPKALSVQENTNSLSEILRQLQESNTLPHTLTPDNIDNSIKTLVKILNALKHRQKQQKPVVVHDEYEYENEAGVDLEGDISDTPEGGTPGKPGIDYPALDTIPKTSFNCKTQRYKGFFGDPDTHCQVWHYCDLNGGQASFLCPNGTIFSQVALTCDWWYNVKCSSTAQLYVLNERLYKYIIPLSPKFPEDYSGPLVDKYLALKFQEMEEKLRKQKKGKGNKDSKDGEDDSENSGDTEEEDDSSKEESHTVVETEDQTTADGSESVETSTITPILQ